MSAKNANETAVEPALEIVLLDNTMSVVYASPATTASGLADSVRQHFLEPASGRRVSTLDSEGKSYVIVQMPASDGMSAAILHLEEKSSALLDFITSVDFAFDLLNHFLPTPFEDITLV